MKRPTAALSLVLACAIACGDARQTTPDASPDASPDATPDALSDLATDVSTPTPVLTIDFEGTLPPGIDVGTTGVLTPSEGFEPLGASGNQFGPTFLRSPTGNTITATVTGLPPHTTLSLSMLFAAIDSLDGTGSFPAGDYFRIDLDGVTIFRESFANAIDTQIQSYDPPSAVVLARHVDLGFQGPGGYYTDSAYDFGADPQFQALAHAASTAVLTFTLEGDGVQSLDDESWAIDNLRVTVTP